MVLEMYFLQVQCDLPIIGNHKIGFYWGQFFILFDLLIKTMCAEQKSCIPSTQFLPSTIIGHFILSLSKLDSSFTSLGERLSKHCSKCPMSVSPDCLKSWRAWIVDVNISPRIFRRIVSFSASEERPLIT